ncbi:MAG: MBL fold metallo-hydrolase [Nocardioides sp.]|uniref:MBL fold metallo-hydrolase n=1 Tax=Nocardioides sp. TaxID=35761 RepID=UPI003F0A08D6
MRLRPGRPDISAYGDRFDVPEAAGELSVTFLGVASLLLTDGRSAVMTDGFFSRPSLPAVGLRRLSPDLGRIDAALSRAGVTTLEAVVPVHSHFDHVMDSPVVAQRTGARLVGGSSTIQVGRGSDLPADRMTQVGDGDTVSLGAWTLRFTASHHCPPDRYPGTIDAPVVPPARARAYKCGEAWSILTTHASGRTALLQGSAGYVEGALTGQSAEVVYLGIGQLGVQDEAYVEAYWEHVVRAVGARVVVLTHWDDFFRGLDQPLRALPYVGDDLDASMRVIDRLAARDGVRVSFPTVFRREDPWALA